MGRHPPFRLGDWRVDPATGRVWQGGKPTKLEPRVMDVLVYLADRPGKVVSREEIEAELWAGRVVGYDALTGTMLKLRKAINDDARNPRIIETVSKKGYRLVAPVAALEESAAAEAEPATAPQDATPQTTGRKLTRPTSAVAAVAILLAAAALLLQFGPWKTAERTAGGDVTPRAIAVLPFDNLSGDPGQEYFADGMTDDLITELAENPNLFVIARDSTFVYKNRSEDVRDVAHQLGVRYIVHGSVRRADQRVRFNVQLVDAATGTHLWADQYDGKVGDLFKLQDDITQRIESTLAAGSAAREESGTRQIETSSLDAYDYFLHGRNHFFRFASKEENRKARELYQKAVDLDPDFAMAYAMLAWTHVFDAMNGWSEVREESLTRAFALATKALSLDEALPVAYFVTGLVYRERGEYLKARAEAQKAIAFDPSYANAYVLLATLQYYTGQPQEGLEQIKKAILLNPHHPYNYPFHLGQAYFILGRYREAADAFEKGLESNPSEERLRVWLAATYALSGREDDARWEAEQVLTLNPEFSAERVSKAFPFKESADRERFQAGLRRAGLLH
jgi:adenylate cyclase